MNYKVLHRSIAVVMVFVVLFSTLSFTISKHYCGDKLVDTAIFQEAKTCGMEKLQVLTNSKCSVTKKSCCSDEHLVIKGQEEMKLSSFDKLSLEQQLFFTTFCYTYFNLFNAIEQKENNFKDYSPPLIVRDIHLLDEVYLI
ncbi:hypothetical protein NHF50_12435 [Flavobacterium sp. NRK F10]|uniref:HYC_CC_PP family protein n=1 Tax=Flavobacterium sp. NRK F10 TaxID=2954931 RepID=UPI002090D790|nr:hypothetical protein [Flavobacterium sp. NRK F10]MCO6175851.1 hypothetical protein [Flavobacterium sp. NRK F10]